jgi:hypothetical protein|tara:strand:- start:917 stop:1741 length:825 start_codon:yes stop_codon:yes gene_type:complete
MEEQTPVEEVTSQPVDILTDEGKFNESWRDSLPDELGKHSIWSKYDNPVDLVKGAINAQSMAGRKAEEFWTSEDENDIATRNSIMGIGSSAEDYDFNINAPEGIEVDEDRINEFKAFAAENGLSKSAAEALVNWELERASNMIVDEDAEYEQSLHDAETSLREEWKGDSYDYNLAKVATSLDAMGLGDLKDEPGIANNPLFLKLWHDNVVPLIDNDVLIESRQQDNMYTLEDQLTEIRTKLNEYPNYNDATYQRMMREHEEVLSKMAELKGANY